MTIMLILRSTLTSYHHENRETADLLVQWLPISACSHNNLSGKYLMVISSTKQNIRNVTQTYHDAWKRDIFKEEKQRHFY